MPDARILSSVAFVLLGYLVFLVARPFATALVFALVIAVVFRPLHVRFLRRLPPSIAALVSTVMVAAAFMIPATLVARQIVRETGELAGSVQMVPLDALMEQAQAQAARWGVDLPRLVQDGSRQVIGGVGAVASGLIAHTWDLLVGAAVALFALFFLFRDGPGWLPVIVRASPLPAAMTNAIVADIGSIIRSNLAASFLAASIQGTIGGLAFAWLRLPAPVLWGVVMAFFCVFPIVGAWLVWAPAAAGLLAAGRTWDAVLLAAIGVAVVHPIDNLLRPAFVARSTGLNALLVLVGILGGVQAFGASGLLLGPVVLSVAAGLLTGVGRAADAENPQPKGERWPTATRS